MFDHASLNDHASTRRWEVCTHADVRLTVQPNEGCLLGSLTPRFHGSLNRQEFDVLVLRGCASGPSTAFGSTEGSPSVFEPARSACCWTRFMTSVIRTSRSSLWSSDSADRRLVPSILSTA